MISNYTGSLICVFFCFSLMIMTVKQKKLTRVMNDVSTVQRSFSSSALE